MIFHVNLQTGMHTGYVALKVQPAQMDFAARLTRSDPMMPDHNIENEVLEVIVRSPGTIIDDIVLECPSLTWNQVFVAIDRLSREGAITLKPKGRGLYTVILSDIPSVKSGVQPCVHEVS